MLHRQTKPINLLLMEPILPETPKAGKDPFDVEQFALLHLVGCAIGVGVDVGIKKKHTQNNKPRGQPPPSAPSPIPIYAHDW